MKTYPVISKEQIIKDIVDALPDIQEHQMARLYSSAVGVACQFSEGAYLLTGRAPAKYDSNKLSKILKKFTRNFQNTFGQACYSYLTKRKVTNNQIFQAYCLSFSEEQQLSYVRSVINELRPESVRKATVERAVCAENSLIDKERMWKEDVYVVLMFDIEDFR